MSLSVLLYNDLNLELFLFRGVMNINHVQAVIITLAVPPTAIDLFIRNMTDHYSKQFLARFQI